MYGSANIGLYNSYSDSATKNSILLYDSSSSGAGPDRNILAYNSSAINYVNYCLAFYDSIVAGYKGLAMYSSSSKYGIALYNSITPNDSVAIYDSSALESYTFAFDRSLCSGNSNSIALKSASAYGGHSIAIGNNSISPGNSVMISSPGGITTPKSFRQEYNFCYDTSAKIGDRGYAIAFKCESAFIPKGYDSPQSALLDFRTFALFNGSARDQSIVINNSIADNCSVAISHSIAHGYYSIAMYDSETENMSIAAYNSTALQQSEAFYTSFANKQSYACHDSSATVSSNAKFNSIANYSSIAIMNSSATNRSIAMFDSTATNESIAMFHSTAANYTLALYNNSINISKNGSVNGLILTNINGEFYVD